MACESEFVGRAKERNRMSIVYSATCTDCGSELEVRKTLLDSGGDLCITIIPCEKCLDVAREEARQEAKESQATDA